MRWSLVVGSVIAVPSGHGGPVAAQAHEPSDAAEGLVIQAVVALAPPDTSPQAPQVQARPDGS